MINYDNIFIKNRILQYLLKNGIHEIILNKLSELNKNEFEKIIEEKFNEKPDSLIITSFLINEVIIELIKKNKIILKIDEKKRS